MKIYLAEHRGFCYGVKRAVDMALAAAETQQTQRLPSGRSFITRKWSIASKSKAYVKLIPWKIFRQGK